MSNATPWSPSFQSASKRRVHDWMYEGYEVPVGPHVRPIHAAAWWKVMCLTDEDIDWAGKARELAALGLRKAVLGGWPNAEKFITAALS